jgi:hypothetical protein
VETCPINDGSTVNGPTTLLCNEGRCSSDKECTWTDGSAQFGTFYFTNLDGEFDVPDGCRLNCTGCELVDGNTSATTSLEGDCGTGSTGMD